jgi:hypothetical protein
MKKEAFLHLFVEGKHDVAFYKAFLHKRLCEDFGFRDILYYPYSEKKTLERQKLIRIIISQNDRANYLICSDLDKEFNEDLRKKNIKYVSNLFNIDEETLEHRIFAVVIEIESWYLAGFTQEFYEKLKIGRFYYKNTEQTTKGTFKKIAETLGIDEVEFRDKLIRTHRVHFSIEEAKERNESFRKFFEKVANQIKRLS